MSSNFKNVKAAQAEVQVDQTFLNMHAKKLVRKYLELETTYFIETLSHVSPLKQCYQKTVF